HLKISFTSPWLMSLVQQLTFQQTFSTKPSPESPWTSPLGGLKPLCRTLSHVSTLWPEEWKATKSCATTKEPSSPKHVPIFFSRISSKRT
ncbi:unnamed protein product, partial [Brassica napus]